MTMKPTTDGGAGSACVVIIPPWAPAIARAALCSPEHHHTTSYELRCQLWNLLHLDRRQRLAAGAAAGANGAVHHA